jgi:quercetin 2,3-dioxygenase
MMIAVRKAEARGVTKLDWLDSRHTFSFADFYDPAQMGFRQLRVINEDRVQPGQGFPTHSHRDMEIVSYVLEGTLEHRDSLGNGSIIRPGEVQRMSAGRGITHSEFNPSRDELVHFLQIWILPTQSGMAPSYEQQTIDLSAARGSFHLIASGRGGPGRVKIHQDVAIYVAILEPAQTLQYSLSHERHCWLQLTRGSVTLNHFSLSAGDGAAVDTQPELEIQAHNASELLLFDLA